MLTPILVVAFPRMLWDPPSALPPGRYLRSTWILREGQCELIYLTHPSSLIARWRRAVFQYHPVRQQLRSTAAVGDIVQTVVPPPYGRSFVRALPPEWRAAAVFAALAGAIHGAYQGLTLLLRFNGRSYRQRIPYLGSAKWTRIIEEVWEDMSQKQRELEGYSKVRTICFMCTRIQEMKCD